MAMKLVATLTLTILGFAAVMVGLYEIYWPSALIVGGVACVFVGAVVIDAKPETSNRDEPM